MKVRLEEGLQLVITPESYVEQVALSKWADTVKGECALLVEEYTKQKRAGDLVLPVSEGVYSLEWLDADTVRLSKPPSD